MTRAGLKAQAKAQLGGGIFQTPWLMALVACLIVSALTSAAGAIGYGIVSIIVSGPLFYGLCRLFLQQSRFGTGMDLGQVFRGFQDDFGGTLLLSLMTWLFTLLWGLLLVVPGVVKSYGWSQAMFLKVDHPDYDWRACMDASAQLMDGHKMDLFILDLSFLGWYIVGGLCLGIGTLWVVPYHMATRTKFYEELTRYQVQ